MSFKLELTLEADDFCAFLREEVVEVERPLNYAGVRYYLRAIRRSNDYVVT